MPGDKLTQPTPEAEQSTSSSSHFVYPVRSLFSGHILSAADERVEDAASNLRRSSAVESLSSKTIEGEAEVDLTVDRGDADRTRRPLDVGSEASTTMFHNPISSVADLPPSPHRSKKAAHSSKRSWDVGPSSHSSRQSSAGEDRTPTTNAPVAGGPEIFSQNFVSRPTSEPVPVILQALNKDIDEPDYRHLVQVTGLPGDVFSTQPTSPRATPATPHPLPFNPSEYGIVHLPPCSSSTIGVDELCRSSGRESKASGSRHSTAPSSHNSPSQHGSEVISGPDVPSTSHHTGHSMSRPRSQASLSASLSPSSRSSTYTGGERLITTRHQHKEDENGNHLVVGREGVLMRCEDEPIRTPGAVQGFGVLIAVDEDADTGNLSVRQVSENSTELLGLSPKYLFSLQCFTETLPDSQADILWDNIQYLREPDPEQEDSPHVFTLTGWGESGSAIPGEPSDNSRRTWTCWCALHPPQGIPGDLEGRGASRTIILEFELERDTHNPLYPISSDLPSDAGSPASNSWSSGKGSSAGESNFTPVSQADPTPAVTLDGSEFSEKRPSQSSPVLNVPTVPSSLAGLEGEQEWVPSAEDILESTTSRSKPIPALERLRRMSRGITASPTAGVGARRANARRSTSDGGGSGSSTVGIMDIFAVMTQINEQLGAAPDLDSFLKTVTGVIKDLSQFHKVLIYQFDEAWNGQVVAELVDWRHSHDLFKGLHFPASDIPAQARELYAINKVRLLYDRSQPTARIVVRSKADLETPLNMTHCYLRAMSPIHIQYLANMGVRASMSVSIMGFGALWGLIACHSYGTHRMRVSFPVRQMLRLLSQSISRNIERLSYAQRLHTRRLTNTVPSDNHPTGHIVSNADDLLGLFDADYGILVIGEGAKILGPNNHGQEVLVMAEYLRLKQFETIKVSQAVVKDFPDLELSTGLEVIAGLLYVPLSSGGKDFIAFLRRGQPRDVHWAGRPQKQGVGARASLEPRKSFKIWSEVVAGRCRAWTDEQMETAGVLSLVYGKFIEVWRQKETALQTTKLTSILLSNASHEVRTPLNHIINYLEMALDGPLDLETRDNLNMSHAASKSLLFTINDLLDLTRLESGNDASLNETFDLQVAIEEATRVYRSEAGRRNLEFKLNISESPKTVVGDPKKIKTVVANLTANSLKYTTEGSIIVHSHIFGEPDGLRAPTQTAVEIIVADTGCGIASDKLESIFREFEQVESSQAKTGAAAGLGLGLAVVARIVKQLGSQLRVDSKVGKGSQFSFLIPMTLSRDMISESGPLGTDINSLREVLSSNHIGDSSNGKTTSPDRSSRPMATCAAEIEATDQWTPLRGVKVDSSEMDRSVTRRSVLSTKDSSETSCPSLNTSLSITPPSNNTAESTSCSPECATLRVLIVEDNDINRRILGKRLSLCGHTVVSTTNGQEGLDKVKEDPEFDCVLMDIQMPILNGYEATESIRNLEKASPSIQCPTSSRRLSHQLNGRIPIFAVSASLIEYQHAELCELGMDGWILKPIDFKRLDVILKGVTNFSRREIETYHPGCNWELGGWFTNVPLPTT